MTTTGTAHFTLPEELLALQSETRNFVRKVMDPRVKEMEEAKTFPPDVLKALGEGGYFGITIPEQYGGLGMGILPYCLVMEQVGWSHRAWTLLLLNNNGQGSKCLLLDGTEQQRQKYLPKLATGELLACLALTEPDAGSDLANISTTAVRQGEQWVLNGVKHFISCADIADLTVVLAVTDKSKRARGGISVFLVEKGTPGMKVTRTQPGLGNPVTRQCEVVFDNCVLPAENLVGQEGEGFKIAMRTLDMGRLVVAASCTGHAQRCLDLSAEYAKNRKTFGKPIGSRQAIQWMLADTAVDIHCARSMTYAAAARADQGEVVSYEASICKLFASEMISRVADRAIQIHGGAGIMDESQVGRWWRDTRHYRLGEGTSEIQRIILSRHLLGRDYVEM